MKKNLLVLGLAALLLIAVLAWWRSMNRGADTSWIAAKESGKLHIGILGNIPPMNFYDPVQDQESGFDVALAREVCRRLGLVPEFHRIFWMEKFMALEEREVDCIWSAMSVTPEREERVLFSAPYMRQRQLIMVKASSPVHSLSDLKGLHVVGVAGSSVFEFLPSLPHWPKDVKLSSPPQTALALMYLLSGEADAMIVDEVLAGRYIRQGVGSTSPLRVLPEALATEALAIAFRKEDQALRDEVQRELNQMYNDGSYARLKGQWLHSEELARQGIYPLPLNQP